MVHISLEEYKELIKENRETWFKNPYDLIYDNFIKLEYDKKSKKFFLENASTIVETLRKSSWEEFKPIEKDFTTTMLKKLIDYEYIKNISQVDSITWFVEEFPDHIYALTLSNTQSRRSRAGKEFENIIELILIGAEVAVDSQANIGKQEFIVKGLGKLVDLVSPGILEYVVNKRNTVLISAKTSLRERWQEVPEEMGRTGAREMFLATLDTTISSDVLNALYEANIHITTTKNIKDKYYSNNERVLTFEDLVKICINNTDNWKKIKYTDSQKEQIIDTINKQILRHDSHSFIKKYFENRLKEILNY